MKDDSDINDEEINEITKIYEMIDSLVSEWKGYKENKKEYLKNIRNTLDNYVHGHDECKNHIERIIGQWMNGKMKGTVFGFMVLLEQVKQALPKKELRSVL